MPIRFREARKSLRSATVSAANPGSGIMAHGRIVPSIGRRPATRSFACRHGNPRGKRAGRNLRPRESYRRCGDRHSDTGFARPKAVTAVTTFAARRFDMESAPPVISPCVKTGEAEQPEGTTKSAAGLRARATRLRASSGTRRRQSRLPHPHGESASFRGSRFVQERLRRREVEMRHSPRHGLEPGENG